METTGQARVEELISRLQRIHQEEISVLRELCGIQSGPQTQGGHALEDSDLAADDGDPDHEVDGSGSSEDDGGADVFIPSTWSVPWSDNLLTERIRECERHHQSRPDDDAAKFIHDNVLRSLSDFTFDRKEPPEDSDDKMAFYVVDYDRLGKVTLDTRHRRSPGDLFARRSPSESFRRKIIVKAFSPSALAAVLLSDGSLSDSDPAGDLLYSSLLRHLSSRDGRFFYAHEFKLRGPKYCRFSTITVPYFGVTTNPPAKEEAPLSQARLFGIQGDNRKYIREERFTVSWMRYESGPALMVAFGVLVDHPRKHMALWLANNLQHIVWKWEQVIDLVEEQTSVPSSVIFGDMRQNLLFDDSNFTNARRYFWALQSLRVFNDHITKMYYSLEKILDSIQLLDGNGLDYEEVREVRHEFSKLKARIERKRQEIESLNSGLFSASSVAESRFSSEQNGNIRLLTLVTIAYLPWSLAATIYGMNILPEGTSLGSFFVVTAVLSVITFAIVFDLQLLTAFIRRHILDRILTSMLQDGNRRWRDRAQRLREGQNKRKSFPASKWLYVGYVLHRLFARETSEKKSTSTRQSATAEGVADSRV
ncbi:hypothetical protein VTH06DRAFT_476 [Thermothelomyces fergusii]